jgi:chromosome segregation ATPase
MGQILTSHDTVEQYIAKLEARVAQLEGIVKTAVAEAGTRDDLRSQVEELTRERDKAKEDARLARVAARRSIPTASQEVWRAEANRQRERIAELERERDEAREDRDAWLRSADRQMTRAEAAEAKLARVVEALAELVKINEEHNAAVQEVIGRPLNWDDGYLSAARAAIAAARAQPTQEKPEGGR